MTREEKFMKEAVLLSEKSIHGNDGGPFGCVVVKEDIIIGRGYNRVTITNDPTAHAEMEAIRDACKHLGTFSLDGCEIYTSCEPCPMCLGAIYWARPKIVYYANTREDAADIGFDDSMIYKEISKDVNKRTIPAVHIHNAAAKKIFLEWEGKKEKINY